MRANIEDDDVNDDFDEKDDESDYKAKKNSAETRAVNKRLSVE